MLMHRYSFRGFRNLAQGQMDVHPHFNVFTGDNAQGKTNLLEGIWLFSGAKSFRNAKDADLIQFGTDHAQLQASFFSEGREQEAQLQITPGKRTAFLNKVEKKSTLELFGVFCAVVFSPLHLSLVKDGPSLRRRFLDSAICQIRPGYAALLSQYNKTLLQRNTLLKDSRYHSELMDTLDIWEESLSRLGSAILKERIAYVTQLSRQSSLFYAGFSSAKEELEVRYHCSFTENLSQSDDFQNLLLVSLKESRKQDLMLGYTSVGIHRDDLLLFIDDKLARVYASQGQQRSCVLALKLSEAVLLQQETGEAPVVLLDDVLSELDQSRQEYLLYETKPFQVFLSCCSLDGKFDQANASVFFIDHGTVTQKG